MRRASPNVMPAATPKRFGPVDSGSVYRSRGFGQRATHADLTAALVAGIVLAAIAVTAFALILQAAGG